MKNKKIIPVFFATDDNYAQFLCVAIKSLKDNTNKENNYVVHVLHNGLSKQNVELLSSFKAENFDVEFNDVAESISTIKEKLFVRDYYSNAIYYRLFIPSMFPQYDKAIYLDCDVIVKADIAEMFNADIGDNLLGAVADEAVSLVPEFQRYTKNFLNIDSNKYFNSGVIVMNLKELRAMNFEEVFMGLITVYNSKVAPDQDCLNMICDGRIYYFDLIWNKMPFPNDKIKLEDIKIIHYNLTAKPWKYADVLYQEVYWQYAKQTQVYDKIKLALDSYTEKQKENDKVCNAQLIALADSLSNEKFDTEILYQLKNGKQKKCKNHKQG